MSQHLIVELSQEPIELCKLLKIANLVSGGGEAKMVISEGYVFLNGEVEYQKRKKIYHQDIIEFNGDAIEVEINQDVLLDDAFVEEDTSVLEEQGNGQVPINETYAEHAPKKQKKAKNKKNKANKELKPASHKENNADNILPSDSKSPRKRNPISF